VPYRGCTLLLDAAHNPAGARALASYLLSESPGGVTLVFGAMKDKAVADMLRELAPAARAVVCTTAPTPRAMPAADLLELARAQALDASAADDPMEAVDRACAGPRPVVVAGSIFLIGAVRARVLP
jgi:dihydrofolate synthase/folylpolyglutamate synthase